MLEMKNIFSGYGKKEVLHNVSASFEKGKITAVIGPNGCGKSTLLKTAVGILKPVGGEILLEGENTLFLSQKKLAQKVAYLPQSTALPDMTAGQMVLHGRFPYITYPLNYSDEDRKIALSAMESMGIEKLYHTRLSSLSGGVKQAVYVAMALCQKTDYILMDEPTTYLDASNGFKLFETLLSLAQAGTGIVVVMHDISLAMKYAHKITVMEEGKSIISATPREIYESDVISNVFKVKMVRYKSDNGYNFCIENI